MGQEEVKLKKTVEQEEKQKSGKDHGLQHIVLPIHVREEKFNVYILRHEIFRVDNTFMTIYRDKSIG